MKTGLNIKMDNPKAVGGDRIVAAVAAIARYEGPIIIIDMGTATTMDVVDRAGSYIGGVILPGVNVALNSLVSHTAQLPRINLGRPPPGDRKKTPSSVCATGSCWGTPPPWTDSSTGWKRNWANPRPWFPPAEWRGSSRLSAATPLPTTRIFCCGGFGSSTGRTRPQNKSCRGHAGRRSSGQARIGILAPAAAVIWDLPLEGPFFLGLNQECP